MTYYTCGCLAEWRPQKSFNLSDNNFIFPDNLQVISQSNNISYEIGEILLYQHTFHALQHPIYWYMPKNDN